MTADRRRREKGSVDEDATDKTGQDQTWTRIGGVAAVLGGMLGVVFNLLHPAVDDLEDTLAQIQLVADSNIWVLDHFLLMIGVLLVSTFVVALERTIHNPLAAPWARLAVVFQVVAASTMVVLIGIDGIASKAIFEEWAASSGSEREILTQISIALEEIDFGVFTTFVTIQYGLVFVLIGLALWRSGNYPSFLWAPGLILGVLGTAAGVVWTFAGLDSNTALPAFGTFVTALVWVVLLGTWMLRHPPKQVDTRARGATTSALQ